MSPLVAVNDPGKSAGSTHQWLHSSAEGGIGASGAFLLLCPTEVMDKSGGCIFLSDKLNLPFVTALNKTCAKLDKLSSCAAVCVYPKVTSSGGCSAWVQCKAMEQDPTCVGFSKGKRKEEKHHESQMFNPNRLLPFLLHWLIIHYRKNRLPADVPTHRGGTWREDVLWIQVDKLFLAGAVSSVTGRCRSNFCRGEEPPVLCLLKKKINKPLHF